MDSTSWENIKSKYKVSQFVLEKVEFHTPFGVFVNIDESLVKGLIKIPDFLDQGGMSPEMYPEIGTTIGAVVVGHNESNFREVYLRAFSAIALIVELNSEELRKISLKLSSLRGSFFHDFCLFDLYESDRHI